MLNIESNGAWLLNENDANLLNALAGSVAIAIDNARLHAEVKRMAMTDVISGLANRRAFDEISRRRSSGKPLPPTVVADHPRPGFVQGIQRQMGASRR